MSGVLGLGQEHTPNHPRAPQAHPQPLAGSAQGEHVALWSDVPGLSMPVMLVRGGDSAFVTSDDLAEVTRLLPAMRVEVVPGAGHAVQSDQPLALTALIRDFLPGS